MNFKMKFIYKSKFMILNLLFAFLLNASLSAQVRSTKPNIIIILADDMGYGNLGCYGQKLIQTPHIDSLATSGIRFTNYYAGSGVCAPSREAMLTGRHTGHTYIRGNFLTDEAEDPAIPDDKKTIAEYLKAEGYITGIYGKWGLGGEGHGPETQGFDSSFCYLDQIKAHNYYPPFLYNNGKRVYIDANKDQVKAVYSHDLFVKKTLEFINNTTQDKPFFLYLPYTIPHGEYTLPPTAPYVDKDWPQLDKVYATMISKLDKDIGSIVQSLKNKGISDNTLIIFASDNGASGHFAKFFKSNGPFRGSKFGLYEGGIHVPFIASWPGKIKSGQVSGHITAAWDILPTIAELTGSPVPAHVDGISFLPTLFRQQQRKHSFLYWECYGYNYNWYKPDNELPRNYLQTIALRFGKWKAIKNIDFKNEKAKIELYDLINDPGETKDVSKQHIDVIEKVKSLFKDNTTPDPPYFPYASNDNAQLHILNIKTPAQTKDFFKYTADRIPFVSSHRGGPVLGFPENCIATFANTLRHTWSLMEIDPHYTKDSVIILMHDPTLDRTSTGHGKISDHTFSEIQQLNLKDGFGNITKYKIPTLDEAIEWAKGKTILILDQKNVSAETRAKIIMKHHADANVMVMCYSYEDAKKCYELNKNIMMEVFVPDRKKAEEFEATGVPWSNVVAFISHTKPIDTAIVGYLHRKGVLGIRGSSRTVDKQYMVNTISKLELQDGYFQIMDSGADLIEADLGIQAGKTLETLWPKNSSKQKYFIISR